MSQLSLLLIHGGSIGDFVLSLAMLGGVKPAASEIKRHALCRSRLACFFARQGYLAGWKHIEHPRYAPLFSHEDLETDLAAYLNSFDVIISAMGDSRAAFTARLSKMYLGELYHLDPNPRPEARQADRHIVDQWLADLKQQGLGIRRDCVFRADAIRANNHAQDEVLIHPGSGGLRKCWPLEKFETLAQRLQSTDQKVQFMIGPAELDRFGESMRSRLSKITPVIFEEDVCVAAEHISHASAYIGNDAGMTHVAAFLGIPTVAIFVTTDPAVWRPLGPRVAAVDGGKQATVDRILDEIKRLWNI